MTSVTESPRHVSDVHVGPDEEGRSEASTKLTELRRHRQRQDDRDQQQRARGYVGKPYQPRWPRPRMLTGRTPVVPVQLWAEGDSTSKWQEPWCKLSVSFCRGDEAKPEGETGLAPASDLNHWHAPPSSERQHPHAWGW